MNASFDIVDIEELEPRHILGVINEAFGRHESMDWFRWKHHEGPWGRSIGVAAVDASGPIGVRLLLPWRFRMGDRTFLAHRATEAATIPRAQGRGVFTALNRWMMEEVPTEMVFSTPNLKSRTGYLKLGWREIARIPHRWELAMKPRRASFPPLSRSTLRSDWDVGALRWRSDPRSRYEYRSVSDGVAILYYRLLRRHRIRVVAPLGAAGSPEQKLRLWDEMLTSTKATLLLSPVTQPRPEPSPPLAWRRGESLLLGWSPPGGILTSAHPLGDSVPWAAADLEGVI